MKASKIYSVILLFTSLTLFTGCSDSITSNAEQDKSTNIVSYRNDEITFISKYNLKGCHLQLITVGKTKV